MQHRHLIVLDGGEERDGLKGRKSHNATAVERKKKYDDGQAIDVVEGE